MDDDYQEGWGRVQSILERAYTIEGPFYSSIIPFPDGSNHSYVRLEISRTPEIVETHHAMIQLAADLSAPTTNLSGPAWFPHLTLAVTDGLPKDLPAFSEFVTASAWTARPALDLIKEFRHDDHMPTGPLADS